MTDETRLDALSTRIDSLLERGAATSTGDEELDALVRLGAGLRGLPKSSFKARLAAELAPPARRAPFWSFGWLAALPVASWFSGQHVFLLGGSSFGLVAGACCLSGAAAYATGLAGAAAVESFIHSTIPYFIALSIVSMVVWLAWLLREQGITPVTVGRLVQRHGVALAGSYAAAFAATMSLSMAMGLY